MNYTHHVQMEELKDSLDEARANGDRRAEVAAIYAMARIYLKDKVLEAAEEYFTECRSICRESGQWLELAQVLIDLGDLAVVNEQPERARDCYQEALDLSRSRKSLQGEAKAYERLGGLAVRNKNIKEAADLYRQGLQFCRDHDDRIGSLYFLDQLIPIYRETGDLTEAEKVLRDKITLAEKIGDQERMALGLVSLADLYQRSQPPEEAIPLLVLAHDLYLGLGKQKEAELVRAELARLGGPTGPVISRT